MFSTPAFWYSDRPEWKAQIMAAPMAIYALGHAINTATQTPRRAPVPVLCVGNMTAGGAGKTPVARAIMRIVRDHKIARNPVFLTRGHGGTLRGPVPVDQTAHTHKDVGDEALLLAHDAPVIVARDRVAGANFAAAQGYDLIVMDDGMQNRRLHKDATIVVIDGQHGFGNRLMIPAGPLRAPLRDGFRTADLFVMIGPDQTDVQSILPDGKPVLSAMIEPEITPDRHVPVFAFCGIGLPAKFRATLDHAGLNIAGFRAFADHHHFTDAELTQLTCDAAKFNATLVTTEKDAMRLPPAFIRDNNVIALPVSIRFGDGPAPSAIRDLLTTIMRDPA